MNTTNNSKHRLAPVLDQLDRLPLECDGMTCLTSALLSRAGIAHTVGVGGIHHIPSGRNFAPHLWIDLADGHRVDYRARMWLRSIDGVPHGVFRPSDWPRVQHDGHKTAAFDGDDRNAAILALSEGLDLDELAQQLRNLVQ